MVLVGKWTLGLLRLRSGLADLCFIHLSLQRRFGLEQFLDMAHNLETKWPIYGADKGSIWCVHLPASVNRIYVRVLP